MHAASGRIQAGDYAGAEEIYGSVLRLRPEHREARLGRGHVRAWQKKYQAARDDFDAVLAVDPRDLSALNGIGFSYAWEGRYADAESAFRRALAIEPAQLETLKGLAYTALWRGDAAEAVRRFEAITLQFPRDVEARVGLGQAQLAAGHRGDARRSFRQAERLDPARSDVRQGLNATRLREPVLDLTLWGGHTWFENNGSRAGVRFGELAVMPARNVRLWFQYDNGLSLDSRTLSLTNQDVPAYFGGGYIHYLGRYTTRLEAGWRELPGNIGQTLVRAEQVFFLPQAYTFKVGGWAGPRADNRNEWGMHTGVGIPVGERFRLEPTFFYSKTGIPGENEWRLMFAGEYSLPQGWRIGGGFAGGRATRLVLGTDNIWDGYAQISAPLGRWTRAHFLIRRATTGPGTAFTVFGFGFTFSVPGR